MRERKTEKIVIRCTPKTKEMWEKLLLEMKKERGMDYTSEDLLRDMIKKYIVEVPGKVIK